MANALNRKVVIHIDRNGLGQILEGLEVLAEQWESTSAFLAGETIPDDAVIRECGSAGEASGIARWYREIIADLQQQVPDPLTSGPHP